LALALCPLQVPAYLQRNKQVVAQEQQMLQEFVRLREQLVSWRNVGGGRSH
jgi:hypothetical protein